MRWRPVAGRLPLTGVAVAGAVVGHMVADVLAVPSPTVRVALLGATGHAYWTAAIAAASALGLASLAGFQIAIYLVQEALEGLEAGIAPHALLDRRLLATGVVVQTAIALVLAVLLTVAGRRRRILAAMVTATLAALLIPLLAGPAAAHEEKTVGRYHFVVGFGDEPAYTGEKNSVQLILADAGDKPVTDLGNTLKVEVTTGSAEPLALAMEPFFEVGEFGTPGDYRAFFIPTAPGSYSFHFTGTIKGQQVDQTFKSGPQSFSDIEDPAQVQYPVKQPTGAQLAARADREADRVNTALAAERGQAKDDAASARTLAVIGLVVGLLGLAAGGIALVRGRR